MLTIINIVLLWGIIVKLFALFEHCWCLMNTRQSRQLSRWWLSWWLWSLRMITYIYINSGVMLFPYKDCMGQLSREPAILWSDECLYRKYQNDQIISMQRMPMIMWDKSKSNIFNSFRISPPDRDGCPATIVIPSKVGFSWEFPIEFRNSTRWSV